MCPSDPALALLAFALVGAQELCYAMSHSLYEFGRELEGNRAG
jgi:hypothetical protein